jgi:hypothetical protein
MPRLLRILLPVAIAALASAATAGATTITVTTTGPSPVTGTATTGIQLRFNTASRTINCASANQTMTTMASVTGTAPVRFATFTVSGGTCLITGGVAVTFTCNLGDVYATSRTSVAGFTQLWLPGMACDLTVTAATWCRARLTGATRGQFYNDFHQLSIFPTGQSLAISGSTDSRGGTCTLLPNDSSATLTNSNGTGSGIVFTYPSTVTVDVR